ncbi:MAG: hypothetical protein AAFX40_11615, partial [Cyanobacteria bacterium J06639_1]
MTSDRDSAPSTEDAQTSADSPVIRAISANPMASDRPRSISELPHPDLVMQRAWVEVDLAAIQ